ncbi:MAG: hypothetical protein QXR97_07160 [Thermoproteota archaeon]
MSVSKAVGIAILILLLIILVLPIIPISYTVTEPHQRVETYWEKEPYQVTKTETKRLLDEEPTVKALQYVYYPIYIDISGKQENEIFVDVVEKAGYDIDFYVFDQKGFNTWKEKGSAPAYVSAKRVRSYSYSFVPDHSDYYYFVLDNRYSWFTNKVPRITASWRYEITVTEYKDVQKQKTVTEYVEVTKTKYVSLLQLLTRTG